MSAVSAASRITTTPRPPASTTPASRSAWSWSGVRARASRAAAAETVSTSRDRTVGSPASSSSAASAAARQTESIVPSTGVPTAAYDASVALRSASTITAAFRSSGVAAAIRRMIARSISLRITPELPRAPSSAPRVNASRVAARSASCAPPVLSRTASRAAAIVR